MCIGFVSGYLCGSDIIRQTDGENREKEELIITRF